MKRSLLVFLGISNLLLASEFQYGSGTFGMKGGFLGLTSRIDTDVTTYSLVTRHANVFGDFFYSYDLNWYDSKTMKQAQYTYNDLATSTNNMLGAVGVNSVVSVPDMEYMLEGLDANIKLGYDVWHKDNDNFLGLAVMVGISMPWIDSSKSSSSSNNNNSSTSILGVFHDTKTTIKTYKIGATANFQKSLINKKLSLYGIGSYAMQTGKIKNDYINSDYSVDGTFQEYNIGLYFTPFTETYKWGFLTLSSRIYATIGYKYSKWSVDKMTINMGGQEISSDILSPLAMEFNMDSSIGYFGVGYSF
jgi:hypothetical protein